MPRKRERTTTKASWTVETLQNAIKILQRDNTSVYKVSKETGIPYSTLSELQEEASIANLSPNTNPTNVLFMVNDKTVPEQTTVNTSTTSSTTNDVQEQLPFTDPTKSNDFAKVQSVVSPLPNISNKNKTSRQKQHSVILSNTPMKKVFEEKEKKRLEKKCKTKINAKKKENNSNKEKQCTAGKRKKQNKETNKKENVRRVTKKLFDEDETDTSEEEDVENICDDESEYSDEETLCSICCDTGKNNEMWYRCRSCGKWAHKECSGSDSPIDYICIFCLDP